METNNLAFSPHIAIQVKDYPNAIRFFEEVLGFKMEKKGKVESEMSSGGIMFYIEDNPALKNFFEFQTGNLEATLKSLKKTECILKETQIPEGDKSFLVYTPYGFNFHLWESDIQKRSPDTVIHLTADLSCPADKAFRYFTEPQLITKWLTQKAVIEAKSGGKYELFWTPEDPNPENNSTFGCRILAIDHPNFIHFEWKGNAEQKHFMNCIQPLTHVSVSFNEINKGKTRVNLLHSGWPNAKTGILNKEWTAAINYFTNAWTSALQKLEKVSAV